MAITSPGPLIGAISGRLGAITFVRSRHGAIARSSQRTPAVGTQLQIRQAAKMQRARLRWQIITQFKRDQWETAAAQVISRDRLGRRHRISGFQLFCKINAISPTFDTAIHDDALAAYPRPKAFVNIFTFSAAGAYTITVAPAPNPGTIDGLIWCARPISQNTRSSYRRWVPCGLLAAPALTHDVRSIVEPAVGTLRRYERVGIRYALRPAAGIPGPYADSHAAVGP